MKIVYLKWNVLSTIILLTACQKTELLQNLSINNNASKLAANAEKTSATTAVGNSSPTPTVYPKTTIATVATIPVYKLSNYNCVLYKAGFAVDADGSPNAYGPNNSGLDYTANAGSTGNWWGVVTDNSGNPIIQTATDPSPGMYVSTTSLVNSSYVTTNPLRYVNSETVPYFVIPTAVRNTGSITIGDIAFVYNKNNKKGCYAIYADSGPAGSLGEGSIYLATQLGLNASPKNGGTSTKIIEYIIFPGTGFGQGTIPTLTKINNIGAANMKKLGGVELTKTL